MNNFGKTDRLLGIFFRGLKGQDISITELSDVYGVSQKTISRDIADMKAFLSNNRELVGYTDIKFSNKNKAYRLYLDDFLLDKELLTILKILVGSRALKQEDMLSITSKLKHFTAPSDREMLNVIMRNELYNYNAVHTDSRKSVIDLIWQITNDITTKTEITITYIKMNRSEITRRILPVAVMFSEYYFYLIAFHTVNGRTEERFYRLDRITSVVEHRNRILPDMKYNEGELRKYNQYMFPGEHTKVIFEFTGPSVQAVLDRLPTARVVEVRDGKSIVEAEVYGDGIKMLLLSQGSWIKVLSPKSLADAIREEANKILYKYN